MGGVNEGTDSTKTGQNFLESLTFYESNMTEQFGPIKILKQNQKPYRYIMLYSQNGINDRETLMRMQQKMRWYQLLRPHPHLVDIETVRLMEKTEMCIKKVALEIYSRYYNHTLEMAISRKLKNNKRFKEGDIFYVLKSLLQIWNHISHELNGKYLHLFSLKNVYLTPEGYVKMYPFPIDIDFVSSPLRPKKKRGIGSILDNEEVQIEVSPKRVQRTMSIDSPNRIMKQITSKDSLRDIGVIIFQLLLLNKQGEQIQQFGLEKQLYLLQQFLKQGLISQCLKEILFQLLSNYRQIIFQDLIRKIQIYHLDMEGSISTNIKLQDGPEFTEEKQGKKSHNLRRLSEHKNLKAGMISILSKRTSRKQEQ